MTDHPHIAEELRHLAVPCADLHEDPDNVRVHDDRSLHAVKQSLDRFGQRTPIVARHGKVIAGNARLAAARALGWSHIAVVSADADDDNTALLYAIADNRTGDLSEFDMAGLAEVLGALKDDDIDMSALGWTDAELDEILDLDLDDIDGPNDQGPRQPEFKLTPPENPTTKPGDLITLGNHRLLCGDSTKSENVQRLMDGINADCVVTDPPYGINQPGVPHDTPEELEKLVNQVVVELPIQNGVIVSFGWPRTFHFWLNACLQSSHKFERLLWLYKKAQNSRPWRGWIMTSEVIMLSSVGSPPWNEVKPYNHDVYEVSEVSRQFDQSIGWHGSVKPLPVVTDLIQRITAVGMNVYDPFLGSGTTLIAAQETGRRCYGMEIDPKYCDLIVERWEQATGDKAVRP